MYPDDSSVYEKIDGIDIMRFPQPLGINPDLGGFPFSGESKAPVPHLHRVASVHSIHHAAEIHLSVRSLQTLDFSLDAVLFAETLGICRYSEE